MMEAARSSMETPSSIEKAAQPWTESPIPTSGEETHEALLETQYSEMLRRFPLTAPKHNLDKLTIYEILGESHEMGQLLKHIQQYPGLVAALNNNALEYTLWAPTDRAFSQLDSNVKSTYEQSWLAILQHHISPHPLPISRLLQMGNIPTLLRPPKLNGDQRLRLRPTMAGMQVNLQACITQSDIMASNGVVHVIDAMLLPPPSIMTVIALLSSGNFSLAQRALHKTGLAVVIDGTIGGTLFLPSNLAFEKLGVEANKFLFETEEGEKYLRAMLRLHFSPSQTLYSNALYKPMSNPESGPVKPRERPAPAAAERGHSKENPLYQLRKGTKSFRLSTSLAGHDLQVRITRYGSIIDMLANKWTPVTTQDCIASNGVIHLVSGVLLPVDERAAVDVDLATLKAIFNDSL